jgi:MSHA biogenesis protein MshP
MMRRQAGFAYIAAVVFLVVLAGFALAALRLSTTSSVRGRTRRRGAESNGRCSGSRARPAPRPA